MTTLHEHIQQAVREASVLRLTVRLQPAMGDGLVYPPTYDQGQHIFRPSWVEGEQRDAVLLDSVQSQANRVELAVLDAYRRDKIPYPDIRLEVHAATGDENYSVLELSHRVYDTALRMSEVEGVPFGKSDVGKAVYAARADRATALYAHAPITLTLGGWDSHGGGGPLVAKLPRLLTSEIVGLDAKPVDRGAVKFDPMDIRAAAGPVYESADPERLYEVDKAKAVPKAKDKKPSEVGLGNVPNFGQRGAVITEAVQTSLVSCAAVRRIRFEGADGKYDDNRDYAGGAVLVALGLYGLLAQMESGYNLRSGCDLIPQQDPSLEVVGRSLNDRESHPVDAEAARTALLEALERAEASGLSWRRDPLTAVADQRLVTLIERSRKSHDGGE